uniref:L antigen family member 3 n=2 Tax=Salmonidae TaxID=8015 RepID=A0A4W5PR01_9TELE
MMEIPDTFAPSASCALVRSPKLYLPTRITTMAAPCTENNHKQGTLEFALDVPFPSTREASIALQSLSPDREPRKGGISKELTVSGSTLSVRWRADEARILRVSVGSFMDHLSLVMETMELFGPPVPQ